MVDLIYDGLVEGDSTTQEKGLTGLLLLLLFFSFSPLPPRLLVGPGLVMVRPNQSTLAQPNLDSVTTRLNHLTRTQYFKLAFEATRL